MEFYKVRQLILILFINRSNYLKDLCLRIDWDLVSGIIGTCLVNDLYPSLKTYLKYKWDVAISPTIYSHDSLCYFLISYKTLTVGIFPFLAMDGHTENTWASWSTIRRYSQEGTPVTNPSTHLVNLGRLVAPVCWGCRVPTVRHMVLKLRVPDSWESLSFGHPTCHQTCSSVGQADKKFGRKVNLSGSQDTLFYFVFSLS